jgi:hypothetical protein
LKSDLSAIPEGDAKSNGIKLGDAVAAKILEARANDGSTAADTYRPARPREPVNFPGPTKGKSNAG